MEELNAAQTLLQSFHCWQHGVSGRWARQFMVPFLEPQAIRPPRVGWSNNDLRAMRARNGVGRPPRKDVP